MAVQITVLSQDPCADGIKCPMVAEVAGEEDLFVITKDVQDPDLLAAFADRIGPGEHLGRISRSVILGVPHA
jgi:hypothetical protein